jgi:hypothetical protein
VRVIIHFNFLYIEIKKFFLGGGGGLIHVFSFFSIVPVTVGLLENLDCQSQGTENK